MAGDHAAPEGPPNHTASLDESAKAHLPLHWRDNCSALLIPLNKCRHQNYYLPWRCEDERHTYEKCQYDDFIWRQKVMSKRILKKKAAEQAE